MRGGGTSQSGQTIGDGLIVDTSKYLNRVVELNVAERWARVEPGIVLDELNAALRPHGLRFAPDVSTASRATVGGMMANNSSGARSVLYGKTIDHVLEQDVVLADGSLAHFGPVDDAEAERRGTLPTLEGACYRVVRRTARELAAEIDQRYPKVLRRVGGYNLDEFVNPARPFNLAKLLVGSEGTLAVVTGAKVNLVPLPKAKSVLAIQFHDLLESLTATPLILRHTPSAVEVMDKSILDYTRQSAALEAVRQSFIAGDPGALLCVEFYGDRAEDLPPRMRAVEEDLRAHGFGYHFHHATDLAAQARIWSLREAGLGLSMAMKEEAKSISFVEDTAVPPERLRDYIERFLALVRSHGTTAGVYAHASVGCLHVRPVVNLKSEAGVRQFEAIANASADLVLEFGGALSGEHGDGLVRSPFMRKVFGPAIYDGFRDIKRTFDPAGLLNPARSSTPAPSPTTCGSAPATSRRGQRPGSTTRTTVAWAAPWTCAAASAPAARRSRARCARRTWRRARRCTRRADGPTCCGWRCRDGSAKPASATTASTKRWTCASNAAPASPSVRWAWTWRGSRASSWPTTGSATARRGTRGLSATPGRWPRWAAAGRRCRTGCSARRRPARSTRLCSASIGGGGCRSSRARR